MANLTIITTQNIKIEFKSASLGERMLAFFLDFIFKVLYGFFIFFVINKLGLFNSSLDSWSYRSLLLLIFLPVIFYSFLFEVFLHGYTPAKRIMHIKVISSDGAQPTVVSYFVRWIIRLIDFGAGAGVVAVLAVFFSDKGQRLGDMLANTVVISTKEYINLAQTIFQEVEEEYKPCYPQVLSLSDKDFHVIKGAFNDFQRTKDMALLTKLVLQLERVLGVSRQELNEQEFIETLLKDYNHLASRN